MCTVPNVCRDNARSHCTWCALTQCICMIQCSDVSHLTSCAPSTCTEQEHPAVKQQGRTLTLTARCSALYIALCMFWAMQCIADCPLPLHWAYSCETKRKYLPFYLGTFFCMHFFSSLDTFFCGHFFLWAHFYVGVQWGHPLWNNKELPFSIHLRHLTHNKNYHRVICLSTFF